MKELLEKRFLHQALTREEAYQTLVDISNESYNDALVTTFLASYKMRPIEVQELQGFRDALLALRKPIDLGSRPAIDVCGTGGDKKNTFNISTLSAFVIAGAGYAVAKHGNYGVSSTCGSSNVLEFLGYQFTADESDLLSQLERSNICFFHAPLFHPAMKAVGPIRRQLGMVTFFNMLGPLVNPAQPSHQYVGVFSKSLSRLYQYLFQNDSKSYAIVHALDGYDEVSLTGPFSIKTNAYERVIDPSDIGMERIDPAALHGGDTVDEAARLFVNILEGNGTEAQVNAVVINSALAIQCFDFDTSISDCMAAAKESLESGKALQALKLLIE